MSSRVREEPLEYVRVPKFTVEIRLFRPYDCDRNLNLKLKFFAWDLRSGECDDEVNLQLFCGV